MIDTDCAACNAEAGEDCRPDCIGQAAALDAARAANARCSDLDSTTLDADMKIVMDAIDAGLVL